MSIDTLLEAARYLEWQAERDRDRHASADPQPRSLSDEEDQSKVKVLINEEAESKRSEEVSPQPIAANHVNWAERPPRPPGHPRMPFAVVPMVPVVTATPLPLVATLPAGSSGSPQRAPPPSAPHQPPCSPQVNVDGAKQPLRCSSSQQRPQVHVQYPPPVGGVNGPAPQTALASHQALPTSHLGSNGMTLDDMRGAANAKRRSGGTGTREVHNKLEQNRRAHLKECFETLKKNVPNVDDKKTSNLSVLRSALRYIQTLKRKEKEYEHEMERLAREKIATQQRLSELKKELSQRMDAVAIERVIRQTVQPEDDQASTSTASEGEDNLERETDEDAAAPAALREPPPAAPLSPSSSTSRGLRASVPPPTVIARAAVGPRPSTVSHPSVIRAVSRAPPAVHKHLPHIAPSPVPARPVGHVAARLGAPLPSRLPALYPQGVSVSQPAVVGHIAHAFGPPQAGGAVGQQAAAALVKPAAVLAPHPQLVGQAAVTMVTVPTFPVSTIKLA